MKLDQLSDKLGRIENSVIKIEEHLKTLNGTVARHETKHNKIDEELENIDTKMTDQKVQMAKLTTLAMIGSSIGGFLGSLIIKLMIGG